MRKSIETSILVDLENVNSKSLKIKLNQLKTRAGKSHLIFIEEDDL